MSISRIKQIKRILKEHDVRDPRGALQAIKQVVAQPKADKPEQVVEGDKPLLQMVLVKTGENRLNVMVKFDSKNLKPGHLVKVIDAMKDFGNDTFGSECDDPNCPVHGTGATDLGELFEKFEQAAIAEAQKKRNLQ